MIPIGPIIGLALWSALKNRPVGAPAPAPDGPAAPIHQRPVPPWFWAHCAFAVIAAIALTEVGLRAAPPLVVLYLPGLLARGAARLGLAGPARLLASLALFA
ncbi:MAG: hypothetical protein WCC48_12005, partial [Anaeromyxobacteraceae bacterium]